MNKEGKLLRILLYRVSLCSRRRTDASRATSALLLSMLNGSFGCAMGFRHRLRSRSELASSGHLDLYRSGTETILLCGGSWYAEEQGEAARKREKRDVGEELDAGQSYGCRGGTISGGFNCKIGEFTESR